MPHFTLPLDVADGPVVTAYVGVSQARGAALVAEGRPIPDPVRIRALVDTGASHTSVDCGAIAPLGLTPVSTVTMCTPSTGTEPHVADQYDIAIMVPGPLQESPMLVIGNLAVAAVNLRGLQAIDALIGRDILRNCLLEYNGQSGLFTIAY